MIETVIDSDIDEIRRLIARGVRSSVTSKEDEAEFLIKEMDFYLDKWLEDKDKSCHLKYVLDDKIAGMILIKNYKNLSILFVDPSHYNRGIGRTLFEAAAEICKENSNVKKIRLNSSRYAKGFYKAIGFVQSGPEKDLPGGCIPFEYDLLQKD